MAIQIGAKPDSGFDDPLGMLTDCHRRIESFLGVLCLVAERARGRKLTGEESTAVEAALNYFGTGGQRHNADEEESLFPRLRSVSGGQIDSTMHLESDHRRAAALHNTVEEVYSTWISDGVLDAGEEARLTSATGELKRLYADHIQLEETVIFPHALEVLDREAIAAMGAEFRQRRR
jgi:hemerythrin-like domain-containing protein